MLIHRQHLQQWALSAFTANFLMFLTAPAFANNEAATIIGLTSIIVILLIISFIPTYIAFKRGHPNRWLILIINVVFSSTIIGWLIALVWALNYAHKSETGSNGGESGLNLFINDTKSIRIEPALDKPQLQAHETSIPGDNNLTDIEALARLKALFNDGAISPEEYAALKSPIIARYIQDQNTTCPRFI